MFVRSFVDERGNQCCIAFEKRFTLFFWLVKISSYKLLEHLLLPR